jgi:hypothetical protein
MKRHAIQLGPFLTKLVKVQKKHLKVLRFTYGYLPKLKEIDLKIN